MADVDWNFQLAEQLDWPWREQLRPRSRSSTRPTLGGSRACADWAPTGWPGPAARAEGRWSESPIAELVLHINREMLHHGAEIALLRDLYLWRYDGAAPS